jgi:hypothetical protein
MQWPGADKALAYVASHSGLASLPMVISKRTTLISRDLGFSQLSQRVVAMISLRLVAFPQRGLPRRRFARVGLPEVPRGDRVEP